MTAPPHFNPQTLVLLFGGVVLLLIVLILGVYLLQQSLGRNRKPDEPKPERVRLDDEAAFTLATMKGVITQLKTAQKASQEQLIAAERRAEESTRKFEVLAREFEHGLAIFDTQGYISFSNPLVRKILAVDTLSRRRYAEIFRDIPALAESIGACFESGAEIRRKTIEFQGSEGGTRRVEVSILPTRDRSGAMEFVACVFREAAPADPHTSPVA